MGFCMTICPRRFAPVFTASIAGGTLALSAVLIASLRQNERQISVNDGRPLASAVKQLEADLGQVITYEDPAYLDARDYVDVTSAVSRVPAPRSRVLVPRGGPFTFTYTDNTASAPTPEGRAEAGAVAKRLVDAYNKQQVGSVFELRTLGNTFHVVPVATRDRTGVSRQYQSMLDTLITVSTPPTDGLTALETVLRALRAQSNAKLLAGSGPLNILANETVTVDATAQPAREVLLQVLNASGKRLSWQIFCSPGESNPCYLNVYQIEKRS